MTSHDLQSTAHVHDRGLTAGPIRSLDADVRRRAVLVLAANAADAKELATWLGALGLRAEEGMSPCR